MCLPTQVEGATIQRIATLVGGLLCLNFGLMFGVTPTQMQLFQSHDTPINNPVDAAGAIWMSSHLFLSAGVGALVFGILSYQIGPKSVLLLSGLLQITSWFCVHFAYAIIHIYSARMFAGFAGGAAFVVLPIFILEISENGNTLGLFAIIEQTRTLGIMVGWMLALYVPYEHVSLVGLCLSSLFSLMFPFVQESPQHFLRKADVPNLEKSLRWYRGIRHLDDREKPEFVRELDIFKDRLKSNVLTQDGMRSRAQFLRLVGFSLLLSMAVQMNGSYVLLNYADSFLAQFGNPALSISQGILVMAAAQFIGATITSWLAPKTGRKIILSLSSLICAITLGLFAVWIAFGSSWPMETSAVGWIALVLLSVHLFSASMGLASLPTLVMTELLPTKLIANILSIVSFVSWLVLFLIIQYYPAITAAYGVVACLVLFALICLTIAIVCCFFVPVTNGRSTAGAEQQHYSSNILPEVTITKISVISNGHPTKERF